MQRLLPKVICLAVTLAAVAMPGFALGGFAVTDIPAGDFADWAATANAKPLVGDFNGDGRADIALTGASWSSVPVAFSNGDGSFSVTNVPTSFAIWASNPGAEILVGDWNADGKSDLAVTGPPSCRWRSRTATAPSPSPMRPSPTFPPGPRSPRFSSGIGTATARWTWR